MCVRTHMYAFHTRAHTCPSTHTCTQSAHTCLQYTHMCTHVCSPHICSPLTCIPHVCTHMLAVNTCTRACSPHTHEHTHAYSLHTRAHVMPGHACPHIHVSTCTCCSCMPTRACVHPLTHVCMLAQPSYMIFTHLCIPTPMVMHIHISRHTYAHMHVHPRTRRHVHTGGDIYNQGFQRKDKTL